MPENVKPSCCDISIYFTLMQFFYTCRYGRTSTRPALVPISPATIRLQEFQPPQPRVSRLRRQGSLALRYLRSLLFTQRISFHTVRLPAVEPYSNVLLKSLVFIDLRTLLHPRSHRMSLRITPFGTLLLFSSHGVHTPLP